MRVNRIVGWSGTLLLVSLTACQQDSAPTSPLDSSPAISAKKIFDPRLDLPDLVQ